MILITTSIPAVHHFVKNKFEYRPITEKGTEMFVEKMAVYDWSEIIGHNVHESAENLNNVLEELVKKCFP